jgi:hypothetical protein
MAAAVDATPDWSTPAVAGPVDMPGVGAHSRFEWTASVAVPGVTAWDDEPDPDTLFPVWAVEDGTMPLFAVER